MADGNSFDGLWTIGAAGVGALALWWATHLSGKHAANLASAARKEEADRQAAYTAMRAVVILDAFVGECGDVALDTGLAGPTGEVEPRLPNPKLVIPPDIDWRWIKAELMYRMLALPEDIKLAEESLNFIHDHVASAPDHEEWYEDRIIRFCRVGLEAHRLARDLRDAYGIPPRRYDGWSPVKTLDDALTAEEEARKERNPAMKRQADEMTARIAGPPVPFDERVPGTADSI